MKHILAIFTLILQVLPVGTVFAQEQAPGTRFDIRYTLNELLGEEEAARYKAFIPPAKKLTWAVYLPDNDATEPPGVFVYVSPRNRGRIDNRWRAAMDRKNLIYIGADQSGNRKPVNQRMILAIMALRALEKNYLIDGKRITVSGFSGGGKIASKLASQYPEVFSGALYICGVLPWLEDPAPRMEQLVKNRFVFLTGTNDFNLNETRGVYHKYLNAGVEHSNLMVIPGMSHELPDAQIMADALEYLHPGIEAGPPPAVPDNGDTR